MILQDILTLTCCFHLSLLFFFAFAPVPARVKVNFKSSLTCNTYLLAKLLVYRYKYLPKLTGDVTLWGSEGSQTTFYSCRYVVCPSNIALFREQLQIESKNL